MIYTKEPANKVFVFVTAYRGHESLEVNEKMLKGLVRTIKTYPGAYGNLRDAHVQGCFKEAGMPEATQERTLKVECTEKQAAELTIGGELTDPYSRAMVYRGCRRVPTGLPTLERGVLRWHAATSGRTKGRMLFDHRRAILGGGLMVKYGLTQTDIKHYRWLLSLGKPHDYLMIHLAQTYRTRKVMYDNPVRN